MGKGKWDPWSGMADFRQQMERVLDDDLASPHRPGAGGYLWAPLADVLETPQAFIIQVELPGVAPEQVLVEILDGDLVVRGERPCPRPMGDEQQEPAYHIMERAYGAFARRFALPPGVDSAAITASLNQGLMTITVQKPGSKASTRFSVPIG